MGKFSDFLYYGHACIEKLNLIWVVTVKNNSNQSDLILLEEIELGQKP